MATSVYFRGRRVWSNALPTYSTMLLRGSGKHEPMPEPIPPPPDAVPLGDSSGPLLADAEDGIYYRMVGGHLDPVIKASDGWTTTAVWCMRLKCSIKQLALLVKMGCFDAAIERGTMHRCLRALDLAKAKQLLTLWDNKLPVEKKLVRRI